MVKQPCLPIFAPSPSSHQRVDVPSPRPGAPRRFPPPERRPWTRPKRGERRSRRREAADGWGDPGEDGLVFSHASLGGEVLLRSPWWGFFSRMVWFCLNIEVSGFMKFHPGLSSWCLIKISFICRHQGFKEEEMISSILAIYHHRRLAWVQKPLKSTLYAPCEGKIWKNVGFQFEHVCLYMLSLWYLHMCC